MSHTDSQLLLFQPPTAPAPPHQFTQLTVHPEGVSSSITKLTCQQQVLLSNRRSRRGRSCSWRRRAVGPAALGQSWLLLRDAEGGSMYRQKRPGQRQTSSPRTKNRDFKIYLAMGQEQKEINPKACQFQLQSQRTATYVQVCTFVGQSRAGAARLRTHKPRAELVLMFIFLGNTLDILWIYFLLGVFHSGDFQRLCSAPHRGSSWPTQLLPPLHKSCGKRFWVMGVSPKGRPSQSTLHPSGQVDSHRANVTRELQLAALSG